LLLYMLVSPALSPVQAGEKVCPLGTGTLQREQREDASPQSTLVLPQISVTQFPSWTSLRDYDALPKIIMVYD